MKTNPCVTAEVFKSICSFQLTPVFLPGESHGQRNLVGYSPRGHKELYMTEQLRHTYIYTCSQSWQIPTGGKETQMHQELTSSFQGDGAITLQ